MLSPFFNTILPYLMVCFYIILSVVYINFPGLNYDEVLFEAATFGRSDNVPEYMPTFRGKPLFLVPYSGSLKGFLYWGIFKIFGISVTAVRLPMILLSAWSLTLFFKAVKRLVNYSFALLVLALLICDLAVFSLLRTDVGPSAIEFFAKAVAVYSLVRIFKDGAWLYYFPLCLSISLGLYNKLNFIWFSNALVGLYGLYILNKCWVEKKLLTNIFTIRNLIFAILYFSNLAFYVYFNKRFSLIRPLDDHAFSLPKIWIAVKDVAQRYFELLCGSSADFYSFNLVPSWSIALGIIILIGILLGITQLFNKANTYRFIFIACFIISTLIFTQQVFTSLLRPYLYIVTFINPWHVFMVYPFVIICSCFGYYFGLRPLIGTLCLVPVASAKLYFIISLIIAFVHSEPSKDFWSNSIYDLKKYAEKSPKTIASIDWGTNAQLHLLSGGSDKYLDVFAPCCKTDVTPAAKAEFVSKYLGNGNNEKIQFILSANAKDNWARAVVRDSFYEIVAENNFTLKVDTTFYNHAKKPVYLVMSAHKKAE